MENEDTNYTLEFSDDALSDISALKKAEKPAYKKLVKLLEELRTHPYTGTGHPKPLGANRVGQWSRKITDKHRLVYLIEDEQIIVLILSAYGHYDDK